MPFLPFLTALIAALSLDFPAPAPAAGAAPHAMATAIIVTIKKPLGVIWLLSVAPFSQPCTGLCVLVFV